MDQENQPKVDINQADADELTQLQGVGTRLAERIIAARPFESLDDLTNVRGISENDVERLRPFLHIAETPEQVESNEEIGDDEPEEAAVVEEVPAEAEKAEEPVLAAESDEGAPSSEEDQDGQDGDEEEDLTLGEAEVNEVPPDEEVAPEELEPVEETPAPVAAQPTYVTRGGACGLIFLGGLITIFLTVVITLGILSSFNNGRLTFASPYQIAVLQTKVENLSSQAEVLAADIDGLRTRMDNLESLSGQVSDMETEFSSLQEEIVDLQAIVAANQEDYDLLVAKIEVVNEDINELTAQNEQFDSFLEGLRNLLENLFSETPEVEETP
jgi:competence ComEA-like helix-hairpin-helix protein